MVYVAGSVVQQSCWQWPPHLFSLRGIMRRCLWAEQSGVPARLFGGQIDGIKGRFSVTAHEQGCSWRHGIRSRLCARMRWNCDHLILWNACKGLIPIMCTPTVAIAISAAFPKTSNLPWHVECLSLNLRTYSRFIYIIVCTVSASILQMEQKCAPLILWPLNLQLYYKEVNLWNKYCHRCNTRSFVRHIHIRWAIRVRAVLY